MKLLIVTAWWPSKTACFGKWSHGAHVLLESLWARGIPTELFITTHFHESKFGSIAGAVSQGEKWAIGHEYTHVLLLEADKVLHPASLFRLIDDDVLVVLAGQRVGTHGGKTRYDQHAYDIGVGWGCTLIDADVLKKFPLDTGSLRDFYTPDKAWFKRLMIAGVPIWIDNDAPVETLEPAGLTPMVAYKP